MNKIKANQQLNEENMLALTERIKELECLYNISSSIRNKEAIGEILQDAVNVIPEAWQYPKITRAKIHFENDEYISQDFKESNWMQSADIVVAGERKGSIDVYYLEQRPKQDEGPFLKEERNLIQGISELISETIVHKNTQDELLAANQQLMATNQQLTANEQQLRATNQQLTTNEQQLRAANQQLVAAEQQLRAANQQLTASENELRAAKEKAEESEEKFKTIFNMSQSLICIADINTSTFKFINPSFEKILGYSKKELLNKPFLEFIHPDDIQSTIEVVEKKLQSGSAVKSFENRYLCKNGNYCWLSWNSYPVPEKSITYAIAHDVTERKTAETAFRTIFEMSSDMVCVANSSGAYVKVSPSCQKILGYTSDEVIDLGWTGLVHPDDIEKTRIRIEKQIEGGVTYDFINRYRHKNGSYRSLEWNAAFTSDGYVYGTARDITERMQEELELIEAKEKAEESEEKYRSIFQNSALGIFRSTSEGRYKEVNTAFAKILGFKSPQELIDEVSDISELYKFPQDREKIKKAFSDKGFVEDYEVLANHPQKEKVWISINAKQNQYQNGDIYYEGTVKDITEKKDAEEKLKGSEERFRELVNTVNSGVAVYKVTNDGELGDDYIIQEFNEFSLKHEQLEKQEVIGKSLKDIRPNIDDYGLIETFRKVWKTGESAFFPAKIYLDDKYSNYYENRVFRLPSGEIVAIYDDVSEKENALIGIKESQERFNLAMKASQDGIFDWNLVTNEIYYSPGWKSMLGYEYDEVPNDFSIWETNTEPEDAKRSWEMQNEVINKKRDRFEMEFKMKHKDGHWVDILSRAEAQFDEKGKAVRMIGTHVDITDRKKSEEERRISDERFLIAQDMSPDGFTIFKPVRDDQKRIIDFTWVYQNAAVAKMNGTDPQKVIGQSFLELFPGIKGTQFWNTYIQVAKTGKPMTFENAYVRESMKTKLWFRILVVPMDENIAILAQEITERKQTENDLFQAKEKAEESDRLKSAFLANMSHEIRTPMNGILGFTNLLLEPDLGEDTREKYIEIIHKSGERMLNTVNDIIEISKIQSGLTEVKNSEINVGKELINLLEFFQPQAQQKGLVLSLESEVTSLLIHTDISKFESILTNLIRNAIKYTDTGKIEISFGIKDGFVQFCVKDTGIGVPQNRMNAIFNRFEQADIEDKRVFQGSGLGLAIAKSYVEMLGGKIWVESTEGKGSTFCFTVPYLSETIKPDLTIKDEKTENNKKPLSQVKILVVEDDEVSADFLQIILMNVATNIIKVNSGEKAIELCKTHPDINVVLMDIKMPGISGFEATKRIREFNKEIIIIAQTAYALSGDKEKAIEMGCNDYIAKPVKQTELIELITKYLSK